VPITALVAQETARPAQLMLPKKEPVLYAKPLSTWMTKKHAKLMLIVF
jgi:hypothetical protein